MPTSSDLVTDLPADFEVFGQAVDTQMKTNADAAIAKSIVTTKGDLIVATGSGTVVRQAVGTNGHVLTADSTQADGVIWAAVPAATPPNSVNNVNTSETTTSTSFTDLATVGPTVTLTTGTKALVTITSYLRNGTNASLSYIGFEVSGASTVSASDTRALLLSTTSTGNSRPELAYTYSYIVTGLTAGSNTFQLKYRTTTGTLQAQDRILSVVDMGS